MVQPCARSIPELSPESTPDPVLILCALLLLAPQSPRFRVSVSPGGLVAGIHSVSNSGGAGWGLALCNSARFPRVAGAAGPVPTLGKLLLQMENFASLISFLSLLRH